MGQYFEVATIYCRIESNQVLMCDHTLAPVFVERICLDYFYEIYMTGITHTCADNALCTLLQMNLASSLVLAVFLFLYFRKLARVMCTHGHP